MTTCAARRTEQKIEFWGLGREGEVVAELIPEFEKETGIDVDIQQIPWTAAHEKILTAHVGGSLPDVIQVGNSWMSELVTVGAIVPLEESLVPREDYFPGIWDTNVVDGTLYGIPWYVDTRVLFYRTDMIPTPPRTWSEWTAIMERLKAASKNPDFYPLVMPTNEWPQPVIMALNRGARLVDERGHALFDEPQFIEGFTFYVDLFRRGFAPTVSNTQVANIYQQFGEGQFAMFISGPWDVGNLRTRLTAEQQKTWSTAALPAPDGKPYPGVSLAGGSSLVIAKQSRKQEAAKKFIAFLSRADIQARFYALSGDLPARRSAWRAPGLIDDREIAAFGTQLDRTVALPRVPEAENIVNAVAEHGQLAIRGQYTASEAALALDAKIERTLEKRRWVLTRQKFIPRVDAGSLRAPAAPEQHAAQVHRRSRVSARDELRERKATP
ncbi:MAG TPA: sugar ABC transporter substrate-binding protein [Thermoanaerobaculia bacterium]|nr:sugar ABC transporter substrate-binding protein [Thermoanaerobaculia bacterium]